MRITIETFDKPEEGIVHWVACVEHRGVADGDITAEQLTRNPHLLEIAALTAVGRWLAEGVSRIEHSLARLK